MKIQCDVCEKREASVYCAADEAALCEGCDYRVHHANKLASKHLRFSLLLPSSKEAPLCDICQERRAFLFCREDRAILCRECDIPIHKANEHTQTHNRFLLTGVKLSASSSPYPNSSSSSSSSSPPLSSSSSEPNSRTNKTVSSNNNHDHELFSQYSSYNSNNSSMTTTPSNKATTMNYNQISEEGSISTSNAMSEYLMENPSGWTFEDLLDSSSGFHNLCKTSDNTKTKQINMSQQVEGPFGSEDYSRMWEVQLHHQGPFLTSHLPPIFLHTQ